jgi:hypothetical protein
MVRRSTWIVLGLFVLVIGFALIFERFQANKIELTATATPVAAAEKLYDVTNSQVNEILIAAGGGDKIDLYRDPETSNWAITDVPVDQADSAQIDSISQQLLSLQIQETFTLTLALASIGLATPTYTITMTTTDGNQIITEIGSPNAIGDGYYVRVDSGPVVLVDKVVMDDVISLLTKPPMLPTPTPEVTSTVTITSTEAGGQATPTP